LSYILDALRKADSDRERGAVPGIHAQSIPVLTGDASASRAPRLLLWAVIALAVLLAVLLAWQWLGRDAAPEPVSATAPPPVPAPMPMAVPVAVPMPAPPRPEPPTATTIAPPLPRPTPAPRPAPASAAVAKAPASKPGAADSRVYAQNELPDTIRRELPQIVVGGSIYSDNAANRFLIINGQVFHEGDKLAPELFLDQIKLKAAVLRFKGYRYGITY